MPSRLHPFNLAVIPLLMIFYRETLTVGKTVSYFRAGKLNRNYVISEHFTCIKLFSQATLFTLFQVYIKLISHILLTCPSDWLNWLAERQNNRRTVCLSACLSDRLSFPTTTFLVTMFMSNLWQFMMGDLLLAYNTNASLSNTLSTYAVVRA